MFKHILKNFNKSVQDHLIGSKISRPAVAQFTIVIIFTFILTRENLIN